MPRPRLHERIEALRAQRVAQDRTRDAAQRHPPRRRALRSRRPLADRFCSNDYLGLSQQFAVVSALQDSAAREGAGGVASHLVCGHHAAHDALERELADWLGAPRALLFGSGYLANLAVVQALLGDDDVCVQDRLNHASLIDAARLAGCRLRRYPHADPEGALRQLRGVPGRRGDARHRRRVQHGRRHRAAARTGAWSRACSRRCCTSTMRTASACSAPTAAAASPRRGSAIDEVPLQLVTLGKALGGYGAAVVGDADADRAPGRNRAALHLHHRDAAGAGRGDAGGGEAGAQGALAPRKARRADRALPQRGGQARLRAAAVGHADPAAAVRRATRARCRARAGAGSAGLLGRADPPADRARRPRAPAHHPVGAAHAGRSRRAGRCAGLGARRGRGTDSAPKPATARSHERVARRTSRAPARRWCCCTAGRCTAACSRRWSNACAIATPCTWSTCPATAMRRD